MAASRPGGPGGAYQQQLTALAASRRRGCKHLRDVTGCYGMGCLCCISTKGGRCTMCLDGRLRGISSCDDEFRRVASPAVAAAATRAPHVITSSELGIHAGRPACVQSAPGSCHHVCFGSSGRRSRSTARSVCGQGGSARYNAACAHHSVATHTREATITWQAPWALFA